MGSHRVGHDSSNLAAAAAASHPLKPLTLRPHPHTGPNAVLLAPSCAFPASFRVSGVGGRGRGRDSKGSREGLGANWSIGGEGKPATSLLLLTLGSAEDQRKLF